MHINPYEEVKKKMRLLTIIESIQNALDCGIVIEVLKNFFKAEMAMDLKDFIRHLLFGKDYIKLTPPKLSEKKEFNPDLVIVDLRDDHKYKQNHITGAVSHSFDDFLKSVLINGDYREFRSKDVVLVCDTGHQSRVAASILSEEGFVFAASLNGGMRRWKKWQNLLRIHEACMQNYYFDK